jgi:hypothetical protein
LLNSGKDLSAWIPWRWRYCELALVLAVCPCCTATAPRTIKYRVDSKH